MEESVSWLSPSFWWLLKILDVSLCAAAISPISASLTFVPASLNFYLLRRTVSLDLGPTRVQHYLILTWLSQQSLQIKSRSHSHKLGLQHILMRDTIQLTTGAVVSWPALHENRYGRALTRRLWGPQTQREFSLLYLKVCLNLLGSALAKYFQLPEPKFPQKKKEEEEDKKRRAWFYSILAESHISTQKQFY